jgi:hypothetical protein
MLDKVLAQWPDVRVILWDCFNLMVPGDPNRNDVVGHFLEKFLAVLKARDLTVIAMMTAVKMREDSKILNPRQRIAGAANWGHLANCIIYIEPATPQHPEDTTRDVWLSPRNAPERHFQMKFTSEGLLTFVTDADQAHNTVYDTVLALVYQAGLGTLITREHVNTICPSADESTISRALQRLVSDNVLEKVRRGVYRVAIAKQPASATLN